MKKVLLTFAASSMMLTACGQPQMMMSPMAQGPAPMLRAANAPMQSQMNTPQQKQETPLIPDRQVNEPRSPFDDIADHNQNKQYPSDPVYTNPQPRDGVRNPFDTPFSELPFATWGDFRDYIKYGYSTTYEDNKYMNDYFAQNHFNRYINSSFRQVQDLYKPSREQMKRFMVLDVLANSLEVGGQRLPYKDVHNPPAERQYKMLPTEAAMVMPTFGEIIGYNRNSYDVSYVRWDNYKAALYYQANYRRIFGLVMEYGPSKQDAWRMVHREISSYANY